MSFVIGDIHGEMDKLKALLKHIPAASPLIFIGDYIDKGKDSKGVIDLLMTLKRKRNVTCLLGNHEFKLLQAIDGDRKAKEFMLSYGCQPTIESFIGRKVSNQECEELVRGAALKTIFLKYIPFLRSLKNSYQQKDFFFVHGGIPVDALGRFRLGNVEKMVFARRQFLPIQKKFRGMVVVFGHTAFENVFWDGYKLGIDTGAVYPKSKGYGVLTAVDLDRFQCVTHEGKHYTPILKKGINRA